MKGEVYPGLSRWALNAITCIHIKEAGVLSQTQRKDNVETEHREMRPQDEADNSQVLEAAARKGLSPRAFRGAQVC